MHAVIGTKREVAKLTLYTEFDLQGAEVNFVPGQYFYVTLSPDDQEHKDQLTHHFSIVNSPNQRGILTNTTRLRLEESLFKRTLNDAKIGDAVEIGAIEGSFVLPDNTDKHIVLIALGIGITPYHSMLHWITEENKPYQLTLIYSDNETGSMPFLNELLDMERSHSNLELIVTVTREEAWQGENRHVDGNFLKDYMDNIANNLYYISGPPKAVEAVAESLKQAGIADGNIKTDTFSGY